MDSIRFTGLASGMDTENIVKQLMTAERMPLNKMQQKKQTYEWQRDQYRDINKSLMEMKDYLFNNMLLQGNFMKSKASSSNEDVVSVKTSGATGNMSATVNKVQQLATASQWTSLGTANYTAPTSTATEKTLSFKVMKPGETSYTDETIKIEVGDTLDDVISKFSRSDLNVTAFYDDYTGKTVLTSKDTGEGAEIKISDATTATFMQSLGFTNAASGSELGNTGATTTTTWASNTSVDKTKTLADLGIAGTINFELKTASDGSGVPLTLNLLATDTLASVVDDFAAHGISASFDSDGKFSLSINDGGSYPDVYLKPTDANATLFFQKLGFEDAAINNDLGDTDGDGNVDTDDYSIRQDGVKQEGQNAIFTLNGITTERTSNTFKVDRTEITLKETTNTPITISSSTDVDAMVDKVKEFIEKYNALVDKMYKKTTEEKYRDFQPLTEEQKDSMDEKDIEKWEEKAKSGLLRRDSILTDSLFQMRSGLYNEVNKTGDTNDDYNQLSEIGIVTTENYLDGGKLMLDTKKRGTDQLTGEERLRKALEEDPYAVFNFFSSDGDTDEEKGIARRLRESVDSTMDLIEQKAGKDTSQLSQYTLGQLMQDNNTRISDMEERLKDIEDRYWRQFNAMEKAMQQANSQGTYLANALGGGK